MKNSFGGMASASVLVLNAVRIIQRNRKEVDDADDADERRPAPTGPCQFPLSYDDLVDLLRHGRSFEFFARNWSTATAACRRGGGVWHDGHFIAFYGVTWHGRQGKGNGDSGPRRWPGRCSLGQFFGSKPRAALRGDASRCGRGMTSTMRARAVLGDEASQRGHRKAMTMRARTVLREGASRQSHRMTATIRARAVLRDGASRRGHRKTMAMRARNGPA